MKYSLTGHIMNWTFHIIVFGAIMALLGGWSFYIIVPYIFLNLESDL